MPNSQQIQFNWRGTGSAVITFTSDIHIFVLPFSLSIQPVKADCHPPLRLLELSACFLIFVTKYLLMLNRCCELPPYK